jgi:hypothetical protein
MSDKVYIFNSFRKRWMEYSGSLEQALQSRAEENVYIGEECPSPWFRSPGMRKLIEIQEMRARARTRRENDGEPTPSSLRDRD